MQSRRDQVQAYFFVVARLVAALTHGRPDILEPPNRRMSNGTVFGVLLAALIVGVFGILGLFLPGGNSSWAQQGTIVIDKDNGARFVYLSGQLRPVLNYSSARLAVGSASARVVSVSQNSLSGASVGVPIGIVGAPDALPAATGLDSGAWTTCAAAASTPTATLLLDQPAGTALTSTQGMLVTTVDNTRYLLWQGKRYRLNGTAAALGYGGAQPFTVPDDWLNPIPAGPDLTVPTISDIGQPGPQLNQRPTLIGQIYEVRDSVIGTDMLYIVRDGGLTPLSRTVAALLLAAPQTRAAYPNGPVAAIQIGPGDLAGVPVRSGADLGAGYPSTPPTLVDLSGDPQPCVRYDLSTGGANTTLMLVPSSTVNAHAVPVGTHTTQSTVDQVAMNAGSGVLAADLAAPGATPGAQYLITDLGVKFPLADNSIAGILGYSATPVDVPGQLLDLLPTGPVLSTSAALDSHPAGS